MKRSLAVAGLLGAVAALPFLGGSTDAAPVPSPEAPTGAPTGQPALAANEATVNCKPQAPVRVDLAPGFLQGGRASVDYTVTPLMEAVDLDVELRLPQGGAVRWHVPARRGFALRGEELAGALEVDLPDLPGVEVEVLAQITIPDPDGIDGLGTYTTTATATWGEPQRFVDGVDEVVIDGALTLDTAATRR